MTSSQHGPYGLGDTRATMAGILRLRACEGERIAKACLSSDCSLQLGCMKLESLVIVDQPCRGEYVPGSCTHRPSNHGSKLHPKTHRLVNGICVEGVARDWG
jgi:hypothetical protein